jgi:hypothetical protein
MAGLFGDMAGLFANMALFVIICELLDEEVPIEDELPLMLTFALMDEAFAEEDKDSMLPPEVPVALYPNGIPF